MNLTMFAEGHTGDGLTDAINRQLEEVNGRLIDVKPYYANPKHCAIVIYEKNESK